MTKRWKIWPHFQGHVEKATASFTGSHEWKELVASPGMICTQINAFEYGTENPAPGTDWIERLWIGGDKVELGMMWQGAAGADIMWQKHVLPALVATSPDGDPSHSWLRTVLWGNEPEAITNWDFVAPFNAYNVRAAEHMHSVGKEAWLGCISVGNPPIEYMQHLVPTTNAADVMVVHSYGAPTVLTEAEWYALRFQKWIGVLESLGEKVPRWFLGETGIDGGVLSNSNHPYRGEQLGWWKKGWRDWEEWNLQRGRPTYREQLIQLNEAIQDERVIGANTFIHIVMDSQWSSFDHNGEMTSWMAAQHRAMNVAGEEPVVMDVEGIRNAGWGALGVAYNPAAAFQAYARKHGLGAPLRDEHDVDGVRMQEYVGGIVYAPVGRWDETTHMSW